MAKTKKQGKWGTKNGGNSLLFGGFEEKESKLQSQIRLLRGRSGGNSGRIKKREKNHFLRKNYSEFRVWQGSVRHFAGENEGGEGGMLRVQSPRIAMEKSRYPGGGYKGGEDAKPPPLPGGEKKKGRLRGKGENVLEKTCQGRKKIVQRSEKTMSRA